MRSSCVVRFSLLVLAAVACRCSGWSVAALLQRNRFSTAIAGQKSAREREAATEKLLYTKRALVRDETGVPVVRVRADRSNPIRNAKSSKLAPRLQGITKDDAKKRKGLAIMRIIGGSRRGMKLASPSVFLRPMMSKVKEALFSILTSLYFFKNKASSVLDLYAGAGSVALEAISRGAGSAVCVDFSDDCVSTIRANAEKAGFSEQITTVQARVEDFLEAPEKFGIDPSDIPFSLVTVTPPYQEVVYAELIQQVAQSKAVGNKTIVVFEYPAEIGLLPPTLDNGRLIGVRNRKHGRTVLGIYIRGPIATKLIKAHPEEFGDENGQPLNARKGRQPTTQHTSQSSTETPQQQQPQPAPQLERERQQVLPPR